MTKPPLKQPIEDNLAYVLAQAHRTVHLRFEQMLKAEGVQVKHWRVLDILSDEKARSMGDLSEAVLMNNPALTKMLDKMVASGLMHRVLDPQDNRRVIVFATDAGLELLERLRVHANSMNAALNGTLGAKKLSALKKLLSDLVLDL